MKRFIARMTTTRFPSTTAAALFVCFLLFSGCTLRAGVVNPSPERAVFEQPLPSVGYGIAGDVADSFVAESEPDLRPMHVEAYLTSLRAGFANTFEGAVEESTANAARVHIELVHAQPRLTKRGVINTYNAQTNTNQAGYEVSCQLHYAMRVTVNGQVHNIEATVVSEGSTAHRRGLTLLLESGLEAMFADMRTRVGALVASPSSPDATAATVP